MRTVLSVAEAVCLAAVRQYAEELGSHGLPLRLDEVPVDDGWTRETAVSIEWGPAERMAGDRPFDNDLEEDDEPELRPSHQAGLDDGGARLAAHYLRTLRLLARDADAARAMLEVARELRRKKPR